MGASKKWRISKRFTGTTDAALIAVPAGTAVKVMAVRVHAAYSSGTLDIKADSAAGAVLMATAAVAPTAAGLKGNTATGLTASAAGPNGYVFTAAGSIFIDSGTLAGAGAVEVFVEFTRIEP